MAMANKKNLFFEENNLFNTSQVEKMDCNAAQNWMTCLPMQFNDWIILWFNGVASAALFCIEKACYG